MKGLKYIVLLMLVCSCNKGKNERCDFNKPSIDLHSDIQDDITGMMDLIDSTKVIELQLGHNGEFLVDIDKLLYCDSCFFTLDKRSNQIIKFDESGNYLFSIKRRGRGRGEYVKADDMTAIRNSIYILDVALHKILKFNTSNGDFISQINIEKMVADNISDFNNEIILFHRNMNTTGNNITVLDTLGSVKRELMPILPMNIKSPYGLQTYLFKNNEELYINNIFEDFIYGLAETRLDSLYYLDYGDNSIPKSKLKRIKEDEDKEYTLSFRDSYSMEFDMRCVVRDYIIGYSSNFDTGSERVVYSIHNRTNNKTLNINLEETVMPIEYRWFVGSKDNIAFSKISSLTYTLDKKNIASKTKINPSYLDAHFSDSSPNANPLLIKTYFKNGSSVAKKIL